MRRPASWPRRVSHSRYCELGHGISQPERQTSLRNTVAPTLSHLLALAVYMGLRIDKRNPEEACWPICLLVPRPARATGRAPRDSSMAGDHIASRGREARVIAPAPIRFRRGGSP